jgi:hypothetical protein
MSRGSHCLILVSLYMGKFSIRVLSPRLGIYRVEMLKGS